uniref:Gustatory receptor n=1 Tax=Lobesia botrana TaxID=209534 RepID=A0A345BEZ4_9NEOP|nr:gustatory receptor GR1 [Lobesia botrana]
MYFFDVSMADVVITVKMTNTLSLLFNYCIFTTDLYFVFKYVRSFIAYHGIYDEIDKHFEMKYNQEIRSQVKCSVVVSLLLWFLFSAIDFAAWFIFYDLINVVAYSICYLAFLMRLLTVFELSCHSILICNRLRTILDVLDDHFSLTDDVPSCIKVESSPKVGVRSISVAVLVKSKKTRDTLVAKLSSYYLLLMKQASFLNKYFGARILLYCVYTLSEIISFVNTMDRLLTVSKRGQGKFSKYFYYPLAAIFLRLLSCVTLLVFLVYHCELTSRQCECIIDAIDDLLVNKKISVEEHAFLEELRSLVSTRPIRFHAANFFNLNYTLILSIASVVVTYAILIIQTNPR